MIEFDLTDVDIIDTLANQLHYCPELTYVTVSSEIKKEDYSFDHAFGTESRFQYEPGKIELVVQEQGKDIREVLLSEDTVKTILPNRQYEALLYYCQKEVENHTM